MKLRGIQKGLPEKLEEDDEVEVAVEDGRWKMEEQVPSLMQPMRQSKH